MVLRALVKVHVEDFNEFNPEFEELVYEATLPWQPTKAANEQWIKLTKVVAHDADCSASFGTVCRYELSKLDQGLTNRLVVDKEGQILVRTGGQLGVDISVDKPATLSFQVIAYDCGGKRSHTPARVLVNFQKICKPAIQDVEPSLAYWPNLGGLSPFAGGRLELCGAMCHEANISIQLEPQRPTSSDQSLCDRNTYSVVSKRRLCGARQKIIELLPPFSDQTKWTLPLQKSLKARGQASLEQSASIPDEETDDHDYDRGSLNTYEPDGSLRKVARRGIAADQNSGLPVSTLHPSTAHMRLQNNRIIDSKEKQQQGSARGTIPFSTSLSGHQLVYHDQVYTFDGKTSALIPHQVYAAALKNRTVDGLPLFGGEHSLTFWMRHPNSISYLDGILWENEHLLCASASGPDSLPRHLYSLYLYQCQLRLRFSSQTEANHQPIEWHWNLAARSNEACDNKWHSFTINVDYPAKAKLYVDGKLWLGDAVMHEDVTNNRRSQTDATQESDNWIKGPEEQIGLQEEPLLVLGACWDSRQRLMTGHFRGQLRVMTLLAGTIEEPQVIECINQCAESLTISSFDHTQTLRDLADGKLPTKPRDNSLVVYQESPTKILISSSRASDLKDTLARVAYRNRCQLPSTRKRVIQAQVSMACASHKADNTKKLEIIHLEPIKVQVDVQADRALPEILIRGTPNLAREYKPFIRGIRLFRSIYIQSSSFNLATKVKRATEAKKNMSDSLGNSNHIIDGDELDLEASIEACTVKVQPPLNGLHESLELPIKRLRSLGLYWRHSHEGAVIYGLDIARNYQKIIRAIIYRNQKPAYYLERLFELVCSDLNGGIVSNEYLQTVTVIHLRPGNKVASNQEAVVEPQSLKRATVPSLDLSEHRIQPLVDAEINGKTSDQLDRLAMAFMVFVLSLVAMMLVIALANLRSASNSDSLDVQKISKSLSDSEPDYSDEEYEQVRSDSQGPTNEWLDDETLVEAHLMVNPLLHGTERSFETRPLISVQVPDSRGALSEPASSHLGSVEEGSNQTANHYETVSDRKIQIVCRTVSQSRSLQEDASQRENNLELNYCSESFSGSSVSSLASETDDDERQDELEEHSGHMCAFHASQARTSYTSHYELYHKHHPHYHHHLHHHHHHDDQHQKDQHHRHPPQHHRDCLKRDCHSINHVEAPIMTDYETDPGEEASCVSVPAKRPNQ